MSLKTWIIALASATVIIMFQNCAKNPNLDQPAENSTTSASTSSTTTTSTGQAPQILSSVQNTTVTVGQPVDIIVQAQGGNLSYQWLLNGAAINNNTNTLSIAAAATSNAGNYTLNVSNAYGSVPVTFTLTVTSPTPVIAAPVITTGPSHVAALYYVASNTFDVVGDSGPPYSTVTFSVAATGTDLSYQWYRLDTSNNPTAISGANQATYSFTLNSLGLMGTYEVVVSNPGGSAPPAQATLTVTTINITCAEQSRTAPNGTVIRCTDLP